MAQTAFKQYNESPSRPLLPGWFIKTFIVALVTLGVGGIGAWIGSVNRIAATAADATTVNRVQDAQIAGVIEQLKVTNSTLSDIRDYLRDNAKPKYVYIPVADTKKKEVPDGQ